MSARWPKGAEVMAAAQEDPLAYMAFPQEHWTRVYSTNPLERVNEEVKHRTNVVGVFPDGGQRSAWSAVCCLRSGPDGK